MAKKFSYDEAAILAGEVFGKILDREADKEGYDYVLYSLESGTKSVREIVLELIASDEFIIRFLTERTHGEAAALVHRLLLGRAPDTEAAIQEEQRRFIRLGLARYAEEILNSSAYEEEVGPDKVPQHGH